MDRQLGNSRASWNCQPRNTRPRSAQCTRTLEKYGLSLKPKVVFYGLYTNDLADSVSFEQWLRGRKKRISFKRFMKQHSVIYNFIENLRAPHNHHSDYIDVQGTAVKLSPGKLKDPYEVAPNVFDSAWTMTAQQIVKAITDAHKSTRLPYYFTFRPRKKYIGIWLKTGPRGISHSKN